MCWGRQAKIAGQYLARGRQVFVEDHLKTRSWEDRQRGEKKYRTEVVCDNFLMLGNRGDDGSSGGGSRQEQSHGGGQGGYGGAPADGYGPTDDDDIPF